MNPADLFSQLQHHNSLLKDNCTDIADIRKECNDCSRRTQTTESKMERLEKKVDGLQNAVVSLVGEQSRIMQMISSLTPPLPLYNNQQMNPMPFHCAPMGLNMKNPPLNLNPYAGANSVSHTNAPGNWVQKGSSNAMPSTRRPPPQNYSHPEQSGNVMPSGMAVPPQPRNPPSYGSIDSSPGIHGMQERYVVDIDNQSRNITQPHDQYTSQIAVDLQQIISNGGDGVVRLSAYDAPSASLRVDTGAPSANHVLETTIANNVHRKEIDSSAAANTQLSKDDANVAEAAPVETQNGAKDALGSMNHTSSTENSNDSCGKVQPLTSPHLEFIDLSIPSSSKGGIAVAVGTERSKKDSTSKRGNEQSDNHRPLSLEGFSRVFGAAESNGDGLPSVLWSFESDETGDDNSSGEGVLNAASGAETMKKKSTSHGSRWIACCKTDQPSKKKSTDVQAAPTRSKTTAIRTANTINTTEGASPTFVTFPVDTAADRKRRGKDEQGLPSGPEYSANGTCSLNKLHSIIRSGNLEKLSLTNLPDLDDTVVQVIADKLCCLTSLSLCGCVQVTDATPLTRLTSLANLDLSYTKIGDVSIQKISTCCTNLARLKLSQCVNITDVTPLCNLLNMRILYLKGCNSIDPEGIGRLLSSNQLHLQTLNVDLIQFSEFTLTKNENAAMRHLNLRCNSALLSLQWLTKMRWPSLESLNMEKCLRLCEVRSLATLPSLSILFLSGTSITDAELGALCKSTSIRELYLVGCKRLTSLKCLCGMVSLEKVVLDKRQSYDRQYIGYDLLTQRKPNVKVEFAE